MASLSPDDAVLRVLDNLGRESGDLQFGEAVIKRRLDDEYRRLRVRLAADFPSFYEKVSAETTVTSGNTITKPTDCESVRVLERKCGSGWTPVTLTNSLNRSEFIGPAFYEMGGTVYLTPPENAPGTYRIFYTSTPPAVITTYDLPDGLEGIIIEEVSAFGRQRHNEMEQYNLHKAEAKRIWEDAWMPLWKRANSGSHGKSALKIVR